MSKLPDKWTPTTWRRYVKVTSHKTHWKSIISIWEMAHGWYGVGFGVPSIRCERYPNLPKAIKRANKLAEEFGEGWE